MPTVLRSVAPLSFGLCLIAAAASAAAAEPNVVKIPNPGFEDARPAGGPPVGWRGDPTIFARDDRVARTGRASLRIVNTDPGVYRLCEAALPLKNGKRYEYSVWVKTLDVKGADSGATICIEWHDANGKWLGGSYARGFKGTTDGWRQVKGITASIPENAAGCTVTCYLRKGMTGTAWFDDVVVKRYRGPFMQAILASPNYRGWFIPGETQRIAVRVTLNLDDYDLKPSRVGLRLEVRDADGKPVAKSAVETLESNPVDIGVPASGLRPDRYTVRVTATAKDVGKLSATREFAIRTPPVPEPTCYIDNHRRVILNGKPFFPLGMYMSGSNLNDRDLAIFADSPFNCLMPYGLPGEAQMDLVHKHGLKIIYSIKDFYAGTKYAPKFIKTEADEEPAVRRFVTRFRNHPALLAWYLNDELSWTMMPRLGAHQQWVEKLDPNHPTWVVLYQAQDISRYVGSFDVVGTDPYPIPNRPVSMAAQWTRWTLEGVAGARAVWQVPQVFNWGVYKKTEKERAGLRPPNLPEMRSMAWQCICEGATGLVFYSFFDLKRDKTTPFDVQWPRLKTVAAEITDMIPVLLSVEPTPIVRVTSGQWLHWTTRMHGGKLYIMAVNDGDGAGEARFTLPRPPKSVTVLGGNRRPETQGATFTDRFDKLAVHIYEIVP